MVQSEIGINLKNQVTDESYSQGMVKNALLLMAAEKGRFLYGVIDQDRQKAVVLRDYQMVNDSDTEEDYTPGFFNRILEEDEILQELNPDKIVLSVYSQQQSLVPNPLFSKDHLKEILGLTCHVGKDQDVYADAISSANAFSIYGVSAALLKETGNRFKNASLFHAGSAFIESQIRLNKHESEAKVSILIRNQYLARIRVQKRISISFHFFKLLSLVVGERLELMKPKLIWRSLKRTFKIWMLKLARKFTPRFYA